MSRWICIDDICIPSDENDWEELVAFADAIAEQEPIEIIRCGECKYWLDGSGLCKHWSKLYGSVLTKADDFCSYGSRSEKPNNSTISKMEQVEPQTEQWHYDEKDNTWYPYQHKSCSTCKHALGNWDGESNNCGRCCGADRRFYEPKDESQTERSE